MRTAKPHQANALPDRRFVRLGTNGLAEVRAALTEAGLPFEDLSSGTALYRLDGSDGPIGWAALEPYGREALLRSVVVLPGRRGGGAGRELVANILAAASDQGIARLWLLTETAAPFFGKFGFEPADRKSAPEPIRRSAEFTTLCPASAQCMTLKLA